MGRDRPEVPKQRTEHGLPPSCPGVFSHPPPSRRKALLFGKTQGRTARRQGPHRSLPLGLPSQGPRARKRLWGVGRERQGGQQGWAAVKEEGLRPGWWGGRAEGGGHCHSSSRSRPTNTPPAPAPGNKLHIWSHFPGRKKFSKNIFSFSPHAGARAARLVTSYEGGLGEDVEPG